MAGRSLLVFVAGLVLGNCASFMVPPGTEAPTSCGYESCPAVKDGMINVHLVPHTHDDVGWLKTVDQYFYGSRNDIQNAGVQYILDSVIPELVNDPTKKFIYVEIAFFARWWREQTDEMKTTVRGLVDRGQLEFILGGWCMNDEASTHYNAIIDQHTLGFEFLRENFGECGRPRVAWQVDPFGHSREQASLFAQMGYDGYFFGRLDYQDKNLRLNTTTMEMLWHGSPDNLKMQADLFTGVNYNGYGPPGGFCFDQWCNDDPIMDDERLHDFNRDKKIGDFVNAVHDQAKHYKTNHIMMTMGSDFQYQNAKHWFVNLDKVIMYTNKLQMTNASKINVLYSTPSCYLYHLNKAGETWPTKSDDFFPYASGQHTFWTGYFTSRAALKGYVRETNKFLQTCKQLDALAKLGEMHESAYKIQVLKEAMGVAQHHDAVSGTEKQHVAYDYAMRLATGRDMCKSVINDAMNQLIPKGSEAYPAIFFCDLLNISYCEFTEINKEFVLTVYNPVGHDVTRFVRLPVIGGAYMVNGPNDETVEIQIIPVSMETMRIPERKGSMAKNELVFQVSLPPLGYSSYFIKMSTDLSKKKIQRTKPVPLKQNEDFVMKNEHLSLLFDGNTGMIKSMSRVDGSAAINMTQDIVYYLGHPGNCSTEDLRPSGAYIFRPNNTMPESWKGGSSAMHLTGPVVDEVHTHFSPWATQVTRMYQGANYVELEWTVGPIPITDKWGKEVIARFKTGLKTNKMFYTDANGREILEREKDFRPTWKLNQTEPVAGNYYPVNSRIYLKDTSTNMQFTVLNDRSQGGASLQDGELEIMLHRRLLYDDCLGCGEPLNETGSDKQGLIVRGKLYFFLDTIANSAKRHREMGLQEYMSPLPMFSATAMKYSEYVQYYHTMWSGLNKALPANVHLVTLEQWSGPSISPSEKQPYLLRLEHIYEEGEDPEMSKPATVSLMDMFVPFVIESVDELILGANLPMSELKRLQWNTQDNLELLYQREKATGNAVDVTLNPMQIRTFQVMLQEAHSRPAKDKFTFFS